MNIIKITPRGYCKGVVRAIQIAKKAREEHPTTPIYILGMLVHNRYITSALEDLAIVSLENDQKSKYELIDEIPTGIVIFTAHGIHEQVKAKAIKKGLQIIDASCDDVIRTQQLVKEKLQEGYEIFYVGKKNHPEAEAITFQEQHVHLITNKKELDQLQFSKKIFVTNQTTMSLYDVYQLFEEIRKLFPHAEFANEICSATRIRQEAVSKIDETVDALIVVGDKQSNNSTKLAQIGREKINYVYQIHELEELVEIPFDQFQTVAITSGASTPTSITNAVIHYIEEYPKEQIPILSNRQILS